MKLNIVKAGTGAQWVKLGMKTFFRQPLALSGLFFMFMALMSIATLLPFIGSALALAVLPAATLGLMAATKEAEKGQFPMPTVLVSAFRAGQQRARAMVVLGVLYALGFLGVMGASALVDGGQFARIYLVGGQITPELVGKSSFQGALWVAMGLYLPLSLLFWHAPALVHWHGIPPVKALFFSFVACMRNFWAFTVFGLMWLGLFIGAGIVLTTLAALTGQPSLIAFGMVPLALVIAAMFFSSVYFTYRDSFVDPNGEAP
jgi:hypothetical protein